MKKNGPVNFDASIFTEYRPVIFYKNIIRIYDNILLGCKRMQNSNHMFMGLWWTQCPWVINNVVPHCQCSLLRWTRKNNKLTYYSTLSLFNFFILSQDSFCICKIVSVWSWWRLQHAQRYAAMQTTKSSQSPYASLPQGAINDEIPEWCRNRGVSHRLNLVSEIEVDN